METISKAITPKEEKEQEILKKIPAYLLPEIRALLVAIKTEHHTYKSPLPEPSELERYDTIRPDFAERIMKMAEKAQDHTQKMQKFALIGELIQSIMGQVFGLIIVIAAFISSIYLALHGETLIGSVLGSVTLGSVVSIFVLRKRLKD